MSLNDYGTHHIIEELVIVMAGLSTHLGMFIVIKVFFDSEYLLAVNQLVFVFNLLPIYPLDGSKILLLVFSLFKDYYRAVKLQIKVSIFSFISFDCII